MSDRPTPETDAERHDPTEITIKSLRILAGDIQSDDGVANLALLEAADCLERVARERDEAREAWYEMQSSFERSRDEVEKLIRERDEAQELFESSKRARASLSEACDYLQKKLKETKRERDEARESAAKWEAVALREASINGARICAKEDAK